MMNQKKYRSHAAKGIWIVAVHAALALMGGCCAILLVILAGKIFPLGETGGYENTAGFSMELESDIRAIMYGICQQASMEEDASPEDIRSRTDETGRTETGEYTGEAPQTETGEYTGEERRTETGEYTGEAPQTDAGTYADVTGTAVSGFEKGRSNLTYLFVDRENERIYTNNSSYETYARYRESLEKMKKDRPYVIISPQADQWETNLGYGDGWTENIWQLRHMMEQGLSPAEDYVLAVCVDTSYPAPDSYAEGEVLYREYAGLSVRALQLLCAAALVFLTGFLWLTAAAGRHPGDEKLHLCFFDGWYTEIAFGIVAVCWFGGLVLMISLLDDTGLWAWNYVRGDWRIPAFAGGGIGLYTAFWFLVGYLSLVRRIKAKKVWRGSLLRQALVLVRGCFRKIGGFFRLYAGNTKNRVKLTLAGGLIFVLQFCICGMIFNGSAGSFLVLFVMDIAVLIWILTYAEGQDRILEGLKRISGGELEYKIPLAGMKGDQKTMAELINNIGSGLDAAVENSLKNERLKTELITNVSHDIKTPLTSIINYVDLLKRESFTDPKICGYLDILEEKAQRLKSLTEDVVEASKASTGNINLEMADLDFVEMLHQVIGEFEERFQEKKLVMMVHFTDEPSVIYADGQRMWRILENIFANVTKYAMEGTRVYAEVVKEKQKIRFSLKNISAQPLNISAEELTERFIRGDISRNTEGSGLGLSIAKSLTELQGGEFSLYLDGDLFKVTITFAAR